MAWIQADWLVIFGEQVVLAIPLGRCWERVEHAVHVEQQWLRWRYLANHERNLTAAVRRRSACTAPASVITNDEAPRLLVAANPTLLLRGDERLSRSRVLVAGEVDQQLATAGSGAAVICGGRVGYETGVGHRAGAPSCSIIAASATMA